MKKREWDSTRTVAYYSGAGTAFDPKKQKLKNFLKLEDSTEKKKVSDTAREHFKELQRKYLKKRDGR